jgi:uncharacterized protein YqeY
MTPNQIKYVRALLSRHGLTEQKDEVAMEFTEGRTTHLSEMTYAETAALIKALDENPRTAQVNKILSMAHEMGWELPGGKVDMGRIDAWCRKYTKQHLPLDNIPDEELPQVVSIFTKVYMSFLKGL